MVYPRKIIKNLKAVFQDRVISLDYPWKATARYDQKKPLSAEMTSLCELANPHIQQLIEEMSKDIAVFNSFPLSCKEGGSLCWQNSFMPGLDIVSLYTMIKKLNPGQIVEIGSGHSTACMRTSVISNQLQSKIICIDPSPRRQIKDLADIWLSQSLEDIQDFNLFKDLSPADIIFFDGSHVSLANSDVTVFFLEILPVIPKGVYICIHDIYLPYDYPTEMVKRGYNEQYLLALLLTLGKDRYEIIFPSYHVYLNSILQLKLDELLWGNISHADQIEKHGGSFWFKVI